MHVSQEVILRQLERAAKKVRIGGFYFHYKRPDQSYKVLNIAILEADNEICVIYQAQYGAKLIFVRPLQSWLSSVEWNGQKKKRFTAIQ